MEFVMKAMEWLSSPQAALCFAALFAVSEFLASIPKIQANSVFQMIKSGISALMAKYPVKK